MWKKTEGSIAVMTAILMMVLVTAVGGAVDFSRWVSARSDVMSALDAAVLGGARSFMNGSTEEQARQVAHSIFRQNVDGQITLVDDVIGFEVDTNAGSVSASGNAYLKTPFLGMAGIDKLPLIPENGAVFPTAKIMRSAASGDTFEIAVALDVTGSMCADGVGPCDSSPKLDALRAASGELIDRVMGDGAAPTPHRMGLVPFNSRVRVAKDGGGTDLMAALTNMPATYSGWWTWCGGDTVSSSVEGVVGYQRDCARTATLYESDLPVIPVIGDRWEYRSGGWALDRLDLTDEPPGPNRWFGGNGGSRFPVAWDMTDDSRINGEMGQTQGTAIDQAGGFGNYGERQDDSYDNNTLVPLTSDPAILKARIAALKARGSTGGGIGTAMAWYLLSPKWADIWPEESSPSPYGDGTEGDGVRKVAILMTDGVYNSIKTRPDISIEFGSEHALALCANMKDTGIEIFTVGFELDELTAYERDIAVATLKGCGSSLEHFFDALDRPALIEAFEDIADALDGGANIGQYLRLIR